MWSEFDIVDEFYVCIEIIFDIECEYGFKVVVAEIFDGEFVERVRFEVWVRYLVYLWVFF